MGRSITISMADDDAEDREMAKDNSSPRPGPLELAELPPGELSDAG